MPVIKVRENEPSDVALRRFQAFMRKAGFWKFVVEFYEKPTTERKRAKASAVKRHAKKLAREKRTPYLVCISPIESQSSSIQTELVVRPCFRKECAAYFRLYYVIISSCLSVGCSRSPQSRTDVRS